MYSSFNKTFSASFLNNVDVCCYSTRLFKPGRVRPGRNPLPRLVKKALLIPFPFKPSFPQSL